MRKINDENPDPLATFPTATFNSSLSREQRSFHSPLVLSHPHCHLESEGDIYERYWIDHVWTLTQNNLRVSADCPYKTKSLRQAMQPEAAEGV